jgi:hypothetical protein
VALRAFIDGGGRCTRSMTLTDGARRVLALNGVTCGFEGTGPRGAAQILAAEGFFGEAEALRVATTFREVRLRR